MLSKITVQLDTNLVSVSVFFNNTFQEKGVDFSAKGYFPTKKDIDFGVKNSAYLQSEYKGMHDFRSSMHNWPISLLLKNRE